jgi:hypothetical protein
MKFSKAKHFWTWFRRNLDKYAAPPTESNPETVYHLNELSMHLLAFGRGIGMELSWPAPGMEGNATLIITSFGNRKYFKKIGSLVAQAPKLPGWEIIALQPPQPVDFFIEEDFGECNIDPFNLWFEPPAFYRSETRICLDVYAEVYTSITTEFKHAVYAAVFNVLGEKVYGQEIRVVHVENLLELTKKQRTRLINLQQLPDYVKLRELSTIVINDNGSLEDRDH